MKTVALASQDLDAILDVTRPLWEYVRGQRIFVTGGTGFYGCWLTESFLWANSALALGAEIHLLSRNPQAFEAKAPHLARNPAVRLHAGDIRTFDFPPGAYAYVIHAATEASVTLNEDDGLTMLDTIVEGTRRTLDFSRACGAKGFLLASSGAVYGPQPTDWPHLPESYQGGPSPTNPSSAYGEGKRLAELLGVLYQKAFGIEVKIARGFAFIGPYLPLDTHFAIGNFIRDGLQGQPIHVKGDGTPMRSYLYGADLATWLWTILFEGTSGTPYNVGSEEALSIGELATAVGASFATPVPVRIAQAARAGQAIARYVPSTQRARDELGLRQRVGLSEAIQRTRHWHERASLPISTGLGYNHQAPASP